MLKFKVRICIEIKVHQKGIHGHLHTLNSGRNSPLGEESPRGCKPGNSMLRSMLSLRPQQEHNRALCHNIVTRGKLRRLTQAHAHWCNQWRCFPGVERATLGTTDLSFQYYCLLVYIKHQGNQYLTPLDSWDMARGWGTQISLMPSDVRDVVWITRGNIWKTKWDK